MKSKLPEIAYNIIGEMMMKSIWIDRKENREDRAVSGKRQYTIIIDTRRQPSGSNGARKQQEGAQEATRRTK